MLPELNTQRRLITATAAFLLVTANKTFFVKLMEVYPPTGARIGFVASAILVLGAVLVLLLSLFSSRYSTKPLLCLLVLIAAPVGYFTDAFGVVVDGVMLENLVKTDAREAVDLFTFGLALRVFVLGIFPAVLIWRQPVLYRGWWVELRSKLMLSGTALALIAISLVSFGSNYASFFREHKPLRYYTNPTYPLYSLGKYWSSPQRGSDEPVLVAVGTDAKVSEQHTHSELVIVVVGEAARADRFSLNGYGRNTNPLLALEPDLYSYSNVVSCGTSTAVSLPCMFSLSPRIAFDNATAPYTENVLDILQRAGVHVLWRDNNSDSKGVALRVEFEDFRSPEKNPVCDDECRDAGMLDGLQDYIRKQQGDILIVLHQMGNHGPAYYKRYPIGFEHFTPACHSAELAECSLEEIGNAYDNAIRYTDWFLAQVIALLEANTPAYETAMLYVGDHGESLGERGLYLHGVPYAIAPDEQTHVPLLLWLSKNSDADPRTVRQRLAQRSSHDGLAPSLLEFFEVESAVADPTAAYFTNKPHLE